MIFEPIFLKLTEHYWCNLYDEFLIIENEKIISILSYVIQRGYPKQKKGEIKCSKQK